MNKLIKCRIHFIIYAHSLILYVRILHTVGSPICMFFLSKIYTQRSTFVFLLAASNFYFPYLLYIYPLIVTYIMVMEMTVMQVISLISVNSCPPPPP